MTNYRDFCKPSLAAALHSVGLDYCFHRAAGQYLYYRDQQGSEQAVLDLLGGYGAVILGHNHPNMVAALREQLDEQRAFHNQFSIRQGAADLAALLNPILQTETGWRETFLCAFTSTGAESVEVALKHAELARGRQLDYLQESLQQQYEQARSLRDHPWQFSEGILDIHPELENMNAEQRLHWLNRWNRKKLSAAPMFIALEHAFHGKLNASLQVTHGKLYRQPFRRLGLPVHFMSQESLKHDPIATLCEQQQAYVFDIHVRRETICITQKNYPFIAGLLVEPVQGEGGVYCLDGEAAQQLNQLARRYHIPLIADEVQSGCGRCGSFLAGSQIGLQPDYVVLSKGLGGGVVKVGMVAIRESRYAKGFDLLQSSTFGEDDWSTRVAYSFVKTLMDKEHHLLKQIQEKGEHLREALCVLQQEFPDIITAIRGKGLLYGIALADFNDAPSILIKTMAYQDALGYIVTGHLLAKYHIRVAPPASHGNVLRIEPSVQLRDSDIEQLITALRKVCLALRYQNAGYLLSYLVDGERVIDNDIPHDYRPWYQQLNAPEIEGEADYKVAFINHLIASEWLKDVDPSLTHYHAEQVEQLYQRFSFDHRVAPFAPVRIRSLTGKTVDFILYPINATSNTISQKLMANDLDDLRTAVDDRLAIARDEGCTIAGLGMFTSIISNNGKAANTSSIYLTTGNALTVAMAAEAMQQTLAAQQRCVKQVAIVGAAGNIGSVYSALVTEFCGSIILVGSRRSDSIARIRKTASQLYSDALMDIVNDNIPERSLASVVAPYARDNQWLQAEFYGQEKAGDSIYQWFETQTSRPPIIVSDDPKAISDADVLICAANTPAAFIQSEHLKQNVLICDIAVPHNIADELLAQRPDITCLRGGIVRTPHGESLDLRARAYLKTGQVYACMAETIVLGLENSQQHFSYGNITKEQVKNIMVLAKKHGLTLADNKTAESM